MNPFIGTPFAFWMTSMAYWNAMLENSGARPRRRR